MTPSTRHAHQRLDRAVDGPFGRRAQLGEAERLSFLFGEYVRLLSAGQLTAPTRRRR